MGFFKSLEDAFAGKGAAGVEAAIAQAKAAWDGGRRCYIYKPTAMTKLVADGLNEAVEGFLAVGWKLHSTALVYNTKGIATEEAMFTFLRPE